MHVSLLGAQDRAAYDEFLLSLPGSLLYHSLAYKEFLEDLTGGQGHYLLAWRGQRLAGVLPLIYLQRPEGRLYNSLPYFGSNGGILAVDEQARLALVEEYNCLARQPSTIAATVTCNPFDHPQQPELSHNYIDFRLGQHSLLPQGPDIQSKLMASIAESARRNVKKAVKSGITVAKDHTQMDCLREIHQETMSALGGTPKSDDFFALLPKHFEPGRHYDLYVAKLEGQVVAALLIFYFNQTVEYFIPATRSDYRQTQPLALILIQAMEEAARRNFRHWNWGGTWASQQGVYRFKKKWGAQEERYYYYTQLNEISLLRCQPAELLCRFPLFFVVPFAALEPGGHHED